MKDMINWIKNKSRIQIEQNEEDQQYQNKLIEISKLKNKIIKLEQEIEKQKNLKQIYLRNCKCLRRKLEEVKSEIKSSRKQS